MTFSPDPRTVPQSQLTAFRRWCETATGRRLPDHAALDRFCVDDFRVFWRVFLEWSDLPREGSVEPVCIGDDCESARFFPDLRLNYAECLLSGDPEQPVLTARHGGGRRERFTRGKLRRSVAQIAAALRALGVGPGDHVAAVARNNAEAAMAALATAAVGATFASCAPDMGAPAIMARFGPLQPVVLFASLKHEPWDQGVPLAERVADVVSELPSVSVVVALDDGPCAPEACHSVLRIADMLAREGADPAPDWPRHPFDQPLFTMFSSGTTGEPKCIRHGAGGTLLEHVKEHRLHCDLRSSDKLFFQTTCGWMMWNWQLSALASGAEIVVYDGPLEGPDSFWRVVAEEGVTAFGTNPAYLHFCEQAGFSPGRTFDLSALRAVLSTGSILYPRQFDWVSRHVKAEMPLQSISGGTDIIGCFVLGNPDLPVHRGEAQCRSLGLDVRALPPPDDPEARIGELVCANPFPSRPLGFHRDADGSRFHQAYFAQNPGFWTHGDLIEATPHGGWRLHGRSDGVLNVRGIRIGTAEIYRILESIPEIVEAMAVEQRAEHEPGGSRMVLLLVLRPGSVLDDALARRIRAELARCGSPAFVPARIAQVAALPVTFNGKRSEAAARDAVNGLPARNREALQNPDCLKAIADHPALAPPKSSAPPPGSPTGSLFENRDRLRDELQAMCEQTLGLSPIGRSDNLLELGADSLALVNLLLEIERRTGRRLSLPALLAGPSVDEMAATLLRGHGAAKLHMLPRSGPRVRTARAEDRDPVCRFLEGAFCQSGIEASAWGRLFDHDWSDRERGFVLLDGEAVVGFIGSVGRRSEGAETPVCNLSSWAVAPKYRGYSMALLADALRDESITYTAFTPAETTWAALAAEGFVQMESHMIVMPPLAQVGSLPARTRPTISFDPAAVRPKLSERQQKIFDDHAPYDCLQMVVEDGEERAYMVVKRRVQIAGTHLGRLAKFLPVRFPYSDILHCSSPDLLTRHLERVKLAVLRRQRTAALVADAHLFPVRPRGMLLPRRTCYRSRSLRPHDVDRLYSELVLLPI